MSSAAGDTGLLWLRPEGCAAPAGVAVRRAYSAALARAGLPFVTDVRLQQPDVAASEMVVQIDGNTIAWRLPEAAPDNTLAALRSEAALRSHLDAIAGIRRVDVVLRCPSGVSAAQVAFSDPWCWAWQRDSLHALTALVWPQDGVVRHLAHAARLRPRPVEHLPPDVLFECLRDQFQVAYQAPSAERLQGLPPLQYLRPPHRVIFDLHRGGGEASCIDLVLLLAGCLEAVDQAPILIVVPDASGEPAHALLAWWRDRAQRFRPLLEPAELLRRWRANEIAGVETTGACRDRAAPFARAQAKALDLLQASPQAVGIDVLATRPPAGATLPLSPEHDPVVLAAIGAAEGAAQSAGSGVIETLHLFFGLISEPGTFGQALLAAAGVEPRDVAEACRSEITRRARADRTGRTRGFVRCLDEALQNARSQGSTVVRESDLWWALLGGQNASLQDVLARAAGTRESLSSALADRAPLPRVRSTLA